MGILDIVVLTRARAFVDAMKLKFQDSMSMQGGELKRVRLELMLSNKNFEDSNVQLKAEHDVNEALKIKIDAIRKSWDSFQEIASDANKIQRLIAGFIRTKRELLDTRRELDLKDNMLDEFKRENARFRLILVESSNDCKSDSVSLLDQIASLKKDNSSYRIKCDQQDRFIKNLKDKEERLLASLKRNM